LGHNLVFPTDKAYFLAGIVVQKLLGEYIFNGRVMAVEVSKISGRNNAAAWFGGYRQCFGTGKPSRSINNIRLGSTSITVPLGSLAASTSIFRGWSPPPRWILMRVPGIKL
jgi:hypothetical protein